MEISGKKSIQTLIQDPDLKPLIKVIYLSNTQDYLIQLCKEHNTPFEIKNKAFFDHHYSDKTKYKYKYAIALLKKQKEITLEQLIEKNKKGVVVILDHLQDPFNLGAILRTCAAAGVVGVIIPKDKQAPTNHNAVLKASQGYSLKIDIVTVPNLHRAILTLKKNNYWIYAAELDKSAKKFREVEYQPKSALIMGTEGDGVSHILKSVSDFLVYIPMQEGIDSLNVSVATGIILFEMTRQIFI
ncbi:23S rRNA (guanosine(2251)-2'-O)-methyltransferase RlmB [Candidatus Mycoplasma haematohominis]|uniref:23S rRNA (Guanosine-2'-O-)-methyltransferase RlmB n=1 Tax=Candidatus Mycoplasma haematohominis TaxID=1494318 RepID=A0A478FPS0_9MOLU|nr:23S rRNA (guanosine(2251)-2'-O)-methyltransferase RlmB [Candidatus Mycoplasma haemohominis]GCE63222.1 23S rRNA (guanosine-2'-O-)-methyltransferase RlmB [Candidatus Mycoplasma haemohominis]